MDDETRAKKRNSDGAKPKRARRSRIAGYRPKPKIRKTRPEGETPAASAEKETRAAPPEKKDLAAPPERETPAAPPEKEVPAAPPEKETRAARPSRRPRPARPRPRLRGARPKPKIRTRAKEETPAVPAEKKTPADRPARRPRPARPKPKIRARTEGEAPADGPAKGTRATRPARKKPLRKRPARKRLLRKRPLRKRRTRKRKKGPSYEDLKDDALLEGLKAQFPGEILSGQSFLKQSIYTVAPGVLYDVMLALRDHSETPFDYLIDVSALDYLGDQERFLMVYQLYSYATKRLLRVKSRFGEGDPVPSMTSIWKTADWLEREVYDMFGILFSGHPDLKRILLPHDWHGFPLRKDYDIKLQDQSWIRNHLKIRKTPD